MPRSTLLLLLLLSTLISLAGNLAPAQNQASNQSSGQPALSNVTASPSATSISVTWYTSWPSTSDLLCSTTGESFTISAVDKGTQISATSHSGIVAGLSPSTRYVCQLQSSGANGKTATSLVTASTTSLQPSIPVSGLSIGTFKAYNSYAGQMTGDTYYNCVSNDNTTYLTLDDSNGFGLAAPRGANQILGRLTSESPIIGSNVNFLPAYGAQGAHAGSDHALAKASGLYCLAGNIYMITERVGAYDGAGGVKHLSAQIIKSPDHGLTWNNFQTAGLYNSAGSMTNPADAPMFGSSTMFGAASFVMYGTDDGSLGYRVDNSDAYVYLMGNDGYWNNGNALYLARIPRAKLSNLNPADIQFFLGGDGIYDTSWSDSIQRAEAVLSGAGRFSQPAVQYIPSLNRYILFEWYYPNSIQTSPGNSAFSQWITYESPHPWGPWTLIDARNWPTQGFYNPVPLQRTALQGTTMTIMSTGDFNTNWSGYPNLPANFTYQMYTTNVELLTSSLNNSYTGLLSVPSAPSPVAGYSLRRRYASTWEVQSESSAVNPSGMVVESYSRPIRSSLVLK